MKTTTVGTTQCLRIHLTSQKWQNIIWEHDILLYIPEKVSSQGYAVLLIMGGSAGDKPAMEGAFAATASGLPVAVLYDIPNQPLFDNLREDDLIAHTFVKYVETNDETYPLLLPMTKGAVKAMSAIQATAKSELKLVINKFIVTGASKRGWTTWLTGAVDNRVAGIAPMVYDNLNLTAQMEQQINYYGGYSEQIDEYTKRGLQKLLMTDKGKTLSNLVDPYTYAKKLTMPKLIINGSNDPYWTVDSMNLYWNSLVGRKAVLYVPNAGHGLGDMTRVLTTLFVFAQLTSQGKSLPEMNWKATTGSSAELKVFAPTAVKGRIWVADSDTKDFRKATWRETELTKNGKLFNAQIKDPVEGYRAFFAEMDFTFGDMPYSLSTQITVLGK